LFTGESSLPGSLVNCPQLFETKMLIKTLLISCLIFFLFCLCVQAHASQTRGTGEDQALFARISEAVSKVKTVSGVFVQERRTDLLERPLISKGHFYFEPPRRLLWETTEPSTSGFALEGREARRWKDDRRFAQVFDINQDPAIKSFAEQVFTWMRADFQRIAKAYEMDVINESPATIKLIPLQEEGRNFLDHLIIIFSRDLSHVVTVKIQEQNGDSTNISFLNILINRSPLEKLF
jgi:outer membrane lipoprotein-sorting protein